MIAEATVMAMFTGHSSREPSHRHTDSASFAWSLGPGVISSLSFAGLFVFVPAHPICYGESTSATDILYPPEGEDAEYRQSFVLDTVITTYQCISYDIRCVYRGTDGLICLLNQPTLMGQKLGRL